MNVPLPVLASYFETQNSDHQFTSGGAEQILSPNSNRWALVFS
jgi:hypothetical protein